MNEEYEPESLLSKTASVFVEEIPFVRIVYKLFKKTQVDRLASNFLLFKNTVKAQQILNERDLNDLSDKYNQIIHDSEEHKALLDDIMERIHFAESVEEKAVHEFNEKKVPYYGIMLVNNLCTSETEIPESRRRLALENLNTLEPDDLELVKQFHHNKIISGKDLFRSHGVWPAFTSLSKLIARGLLIELPPSNINIITGRKWQDVWEEKIFQITPPGMDLAKLIEERNPNRKEDPFNNHKLSISVLTVSTTHQTPDISISSNPIQ